MSILVARIGRNSLSRFPAARRSGSPIFEVWQEMWDWNTSETLLRRKSCEAQLDKLSKEND